MFVLKTEKLLFVCYAKETTAVMLVHFDQNLWSEIMDEVSSVYRPRSTRPTRKSGNVKLIENKIKEFQEKNVELIAEVKSTTADVCLNTSVDSLYCTHVGSNMKETTLVEDEIAQILRETENAFRFAYKLNRS
jgi:hypothetical protein